MRKRLFFAVGLFALAFAAFASLAHTAPPEAKRQHDCPCCKCGKAEAAPAKLPVVAQQAAPVEGPFGGDVGKRLLLRVVRNRAVDRLASHGFKDAGAAFANSKPISREKARELVDGIDDDVILKHVAEKYPQAIGEGGRLEAIVNWLIEHKEEIMQLVKFLISLLALFMDDGGQSLAAPDHTGPSPVMPQAEAAWLMAC